MLSRAGHAAGRLGLSEDVAVVELCTRLGALHQHRVAFALGEYPDVDHEYLDVEVCCMLMVKSADAFAVVVTANLFGDITTDFGAAIQSGMGTAASGGIPPA